MTDPLSPQNRRRSASDIQGWMVHYLAKLLDVPTEQVALDKNFEDWALDSTAAVGMVGDLEDWLGYELDPTLPYEFPSIKLLSEHVAALAPSNS